MGLAILLVVSTLLGWLGKPTSRWQSAGILALLLVFILLKSPALALWMSGCIRGWVGQSTANASALDIRWLGFSYVAFRLIHTLRDRQAGRLRDVSLLDYVNYVIFFPAISAGPIDRVQRFSKDLQQPVTRDLNAFSAALYRRVVGLFKKYALADTLALLALNSQNAAQIQANGWGWLLVYAFAFQIYFDFAGYTDIAIGLGQLLGIQLPENFNRPYLKPNLTQFWNNWHITLTQWFRAYFFNPFTRSLRTRYRDLGAVWVILVTQLSTMLLIGLWHGITWNFVLWGAWHGLGLFIQNRYSDWMRPRVARWDGSASSSAGIEHLQCTCSPSILWRWDGSGLPCHRFRYHSTFLPGYSGWDLKGRSRMHTRFYRNVVLKALLLLVILNLLLAFLPCIHRQRSAFPL